MKNNFQNTLPLEAGRVSPKASKAAAKSGNPVGDIVTPDQNPFVHHLFSFKALSTHAPTGSFPPAKNHA